MTEKELYDLLVTLQKPVAYNHFIEKKEPPFILYLATGTDNFNADDKTYKKIQNYDIVLVTAIKDVQLEASVETLLETNNLPYDKVEDYIESEQIYQVTYSI